MTCESHAYGCPAPHSEPFPDCTADGRPIVWYTSDLSAAGLLKIFERVKPRLSGRTAVKLHTGEPHGPNILPRDWVKALMAEIAQSSIVECNVWYDSPRKTTEGHRELLKTNGWTFCPVDIMDAEGDAALPIPDGKVLKEIHVGKRLLDYESMLVLTHFKGHARGGFGGALKNIAIGCASGAAGKAEQHVAPDGSMRAGAAFMEAMADAGLAVARRFGKKIVYINVMRRMSVSCDCEGLKAQPVKLPDLGIVASTDILAADQACVDFVYSLPKAVRAPMVERIESREGLAQLSAMRDRGMGRSDYELVSID